eukprot:GHVT01014089.1.p1 GENE.GHVT01014089.1~~GHVT01014089.1.p1  ORF type:complete len:287 (-),score=29.25 GHVT01014089.1:369-1229(-)
MVGSLVETSAIVWHASIPVVFWWCPPGEAHTLALDVSNNLYSWGYGQHGQLGVGPLPGPGAPPRSQPLCASSSVAASSSSSFSGAFSDAGHVAFNCSQRSDESYVMRSSACWIGRLGRRRINSVFAGGSFSGAVDAQGGVWVWGSNTHGTLGTQPSTEDVRWTPGKVEMPSPVRCGYSDRGGHRVVVIDREGHSFVWGRDIDGCCGFSVDSDSLPERPLVNWLPQRLDPAEGGRIAQVACGWRHTLLLTRPTGEQPLRDKPTRELTTLLSLHQSSSGSCRTPPTQK